MRKLPVALAVLSLSAVGLTGCSLPGSAEACPQPTGTADALDLIEVSGGAQSLPQVDVYTPFHVESSQWGELAQGEGTQIDGSESQLVVIDVSVVSGDTGEGLVATPYDGSLTNVNAMSVWSQTFPVFPEALRCASAGSQVVVAMAPDDIDPEVASGLGLTEGESAIAVVDVRKVYLDHADGSNVFNTGNGLPIVVRAPDGRPGVVVPDGEAPDDVVVQTLKRGDGAEVADGDAVRVHYTAVSWDDDEVTGTTWDTTPASIAAGGTEDPVSAELTGHTVGSQLMVVVPAADEASSASIYVIDILGIDATE
ncbi:peptidylprolyl isomerase [Microbacterium terrae]|uniref:Peptidylprolyl isomerase n=1 Tax=Microbacterium terrae TaxID=69369 RepID=A0A0M2GWC1_9MICO|nr:hypothetical protein [Microbacterium terrae]KJL38039.1 hypothetical protein RS81_03036 [Microbacterium terrae]MBP1077451.1 peptidylprolyl isomerase [Microbacterium terrae]GLJ99058.1 hypothetical protein GCM10017594_22550 [Microbacterium terrae]